MGISLKEVKDRLAEVDVYSRNALTGGLVEHQGMEAGDLKVIYRVVAGKSAQDEAKINQELQAITWRAKNEESLEDDPVRQAELFTDLITSQVVEWDLSEVPGGPVIPITADIGKTVPTDILADVIDAINNHRRPTGNGSRRSSKR